VSEKETLQCSCNHQESHSTYPAAHIAVGAVGLNVRDPIVVDHVHVSDEDHMSDERRTPRQALKLIDERASACTVGDVSTYLKGTLSSALRNHSYTRIQSVF
jgi:hypothetical protein